MVEFLWSGCKWSAFLCTVIVPDMLHGLQPGNWSSNTSTGTSIGKSGWVCGKPQLYCGASADGVVPCTPW